MTEEEVVAENRQEDIVDEICEVYLVNNKLKHGLHGKKSNNAKTETYLMIVSLLLI